MSINSLYSGNTYIIICYPFVLNIADDIKLPLSSLAIMTLQAYVNHLGLYTMPSQTGHNTFSLA